MNKRIAHNIFEGINPVLNEKLLHEGWHEFHNLYLGDILKLLRADLTLKGYSISLEESVQVYRMGYNPVIYRADALISRPPNPTLTSGAETQKIPTVATEVMPISEALIPQEYPDIMAIVIRKRRHNKPITWIELLSPTNKLPNQAFYDYQLKREDIIKSRVCYIELDFIHNQLPTYRNMMRYVDGGYPFHASLITPRPDVQDGIATMYHFGVADKIPTIPIPLEGDDTHIFDFNMAYQKTFIESSYGLELDYHDLDLSTYLERDRQYILKRIASALGDDVSPT
jgi:hypothetical protein